MKIKFKEYVEEHRKELENNPYVSKVSKTIQYSPEFKIKAVELRREGIPLRRIFEMHNLPYEKECCKSYIKKWMKQYDELGKESFYKETRGRSKKGKTGRPKKADEITLEEKVLIQEKIIEAQKMEIEELKKQLWQGKVVKRRNNNEYMPTQIIYKFINELKDKTTVSIQRICKYFNVSRSGYYKWVHNSEKREKRELQDKTDFEIIHSIWSKKKEYGYLRITMSLKNDLGIIMNPKKVYRLMKKYGIRSTVRKKRPYAALNNEYKKHYYFDNVLNRKFDVKKPDTVYATDITYLIWGNNRYYLSVVKDLGSNECVAWHVSKTCGLELSINVIEQLTSRLGRNKMNGVMIHSDQGGHYTNPTYVNKLKDLGVIQSMSRRGNCLDNAKMETFFGHFKDECPFFKAKSYEDLVKIISDYMYYYNNQRYQWRLKKMAPVQYRNHLLSA